MADFRKTGDYLWRKYNGAIQVVMDQDGTGFTVANKRFKKPTKNDLVYFENSPDYCIRDRDAGRSRLFGTLPPTPPHNPFGAWNTLLKSLTLSPHLLVLPAALGFNTHILEYRFKGYKRTFFNNRKTYNVEILEK